MSDIAISIRDLSKSFRRFPHPGWRALDALGFPVSTRRYDIFQALADINLEIARGEKVALIGRNGAGKSTLLRLISGQMKADKGSVVVNGQVQALMSLGTGFHPDFSGIQNIHSALAYQGMSPQKIASHIVEIAEFTELEGFLERPVKEYSSGMYARLAFAVATSITPEVLIIDEVLGAGDAYFMGKCIQRMKTLTSQGATILFVSHDIGSVQALCDRGVWLDHGQIRQDGPLLPVSKAYLASIREEEEKSVRARSMSLSRRQMKEIMAKDRETTLLRLLARDGTPPARSLSLAGVRFGDQAGEHGSITPDTAADSASRVLVEPGFMNWRAGEVQGRQGWQFGDFGGRYLHAPMQLCWSDQPGDERWVELDIIPSTSCEVTIAQFDDSSDSYVELGSIPAAPSGADWRTLRLSLLAPQAQSASRRLLNDLPALSPDERYGSGEIHITGFGFLDAEQSQRHTLITGEPASAVIAYSAQDSVNDPIPVIAIYRPDGSCAMQVISSLSGKTFPVLSGEGGIRVSFSPLLLGPGDYLVSVALFRELNLASSIEPAAYDLHDRCYALKVLPPVGIQVEIGTVNQPASWEMLS